MYVIHRLIALVALALAPWGFAQGATFLVTSNGVGQAGQTPLQSVGITLVNGGDVFTIGALYFYDPAKLQVVGVQNNSNFSCNVGGGQIQVLAPFPGAGGTCNVFLQPITGTPYPQGIGIPGVLTACVSANPFNPFPCSVGSGGYTIIGPQIFGSPTLGGGITLTSSVGLDPPTALATITNVGNSGSVLSVNAGTTGAPAQVSPSGSGALLGLGGSRNYTISCATDTAGTSVRNITFGHNAIPLQATPQAYQLTCNIKDPPTLVGARHRLPV